MTNLLKKLLQDKNYSLRTQISLSPSLRRMIDVKRKIYGETLAEYIRKAAVLRMLVEEVEKEEMARLAKIARGSIPLKKHPEFSTRKKRIKWQKKIREDRR